MENQSTRSMAVILVTLVSFIASLTVSAESGAEEKQESDRLRVLVWNVWKGTNKVDKGPEKALELIKKSKADICLLQESYDIAGERPQFGPWAAQQLGWNFYQGKSPHLCIISRYEIKEELFHSAWHCIGAELEDDKGRTIHAFNIWIDYKSYLPDYLMEHPQADEAELLSCETVKSDRQKQSLAILEYLKKNQFTSMDTPLLVGGDWNTPSHLDWTDATREALPYRRALDLPVSLSMQKEGFVDTYRTVYPDPVKHAGNTWSPLFRMKDGKPLPLDRIDRLYYKTNREKPRLRPVSTETYPKVLESNKIPVRERQFPSDHAALLIELEWQDRKAE